MMDIKFRAWDMISKSFLVAGGRGGVDLITHRNPREMTITLLSENKSIILMQAIGIFDKNGKEVFVKDIVKASNYIAIAGYDNGYPRAINSCDGCRRDLLLFSDLEIVGNLYENEDFINKLNGGF